MAVGAQTTQNQVNGVLTQLAVRKRDLADDILYQQAFLVKLGLAGLQGLGFTAGEAQAVLDDIDHMATPEQVYKGAVQAGGTGGTGAVMFDYEDYLTHLWAGG